MGTQADQNEIGVMTIGVEIVGLTGAMTVQDMMTGIQVTVVTGGGTTRTTEVDIDETVGQDPGPPGGRDPGIRITEDGGGLRKE